MQDDNNKITFRLLVFERLSWHYARLRCTKEDYLDDWQTEYNGYEVNQPEEMNPIAPIYS